MPATKAHSTGGAKKKNDRRKKEITSGKKYARGKAYIYMTVAS